MRARRINNLLRNRSLVINGLRIAWAVLILWFEFGAFMWSVRHCSWPDAVWRQVSFFGHLHRENRVLMELHCVGNIFQPQVHKNVPDVSPAHLLVLADTQVLDPHSLPSVHPWFRRLVRFIFESNLRKNWITARSLRPDGVIFLGDMINGGRYARSDEESV